MPDPLTIVTCSTGGVLQWWDIPPEVAATAPIELTARQQVVAHADSMHFLPSWDGGRALLLVRTNERMLRLLDGSTGEMLGEMRCHDDFDQVVRTSSSTAVLWHDDGSLRGIALDGLRPLWRKVDHMSEYQTSAVLPDGRLVRAAFGIVVEDPHTGNVLQSFDAPDPDDDMAMSAEDDPDEPTPPTPPSTLDRPPSMFSFADFESVDDETLRADKELALGTQRALQDSIGWGGTVYLLARRPASPLSREDVVRIARWLYHEHDVLVDRVGYARQAAPGGEQYEWFLRIDQIDGASTTDTRRSMDKLRTRGVTGPMP